MADISEEGGVSGSRSPRYPAFGILEAVEKARQLYAREKKATVPSEVAVRAWGYGTLNGRSLRALGAMRQFNLIDSPVPKMVRLTPTALILVLESEGSPLRAKALAEAALAPPAFAMLKEQYPDDLPSDDSLISHLVRTSSFSEESAAALIAAFRESIAVAGEPPKPDIPESRSDDGERREPRSHQPTGGRKMLIPPQALALPGNALVTLSVEGMPTTESLPIMRSWLELVRQSLELQVEAANRSLTEGKDVPLT